MSQFKDQFCSVLFDFIMKRDLPPPPFVRLPVADTSCDVKDVRTANHTEAGLLKNVIGSDALVWADVKMLNRAAFVFYASLRQEPMYKGMKQVLKCMAIIKELNIVDIVFSLVDSSMLIRHKQLFPSKQYIRYILCRVLGAAVLAAQTGDYCMYTTRNLLLKMHLGHHLPACIAISALVSRIWVISQIMIHHLVNLYSSIYKLLDIVSSADYTWLPEGIVLPCKIPFNLANSAENVDETSVSTCESSERVVNRTQQNGEDEMKVVHKQPKFEKSKFTDKMAEDVGIPISREAFEKVIKETTDTQQEKHAGKTRKRKRKDGCKAARKTAKKSFST